MAFVSATSGVIGDTVTVGKETLQVLYTPGHTPGSTSFYFKDDRLLLAGDTLFLGSVGRTDFPGGDSRALKNSIQQRLYSLDESAVVVTGHGPETSIGQEMRHNAYVRAA